jgi:diaminopimelate epimerase
LLPRLAGHLCSRETGIAVDGLLAVLAVRGESVDVCLVNPDGSSAGFCGNGARCLARFCAETGLTGRDPLLRFPGLEVRGHYRDGAWAEVVVPPPRLLIRGMALPPSLGVEGAADLVDAGVPHLVLIEEIAGSLDLERIGPPLRSDPRAGPEGANVTLCSPGPAEGDASVRTFERGVEGITGACGSGALAAAAVLWERNPGGAGLTLWPPSGRGLQVSRRGSEVALAGDALCRLRGELPEEAWRGVT